MRPAKLLQPHYFDTFRCVGSECEDTCCVGWIVHIDKTTYDKYQSCADPIISPYLHELVNINTTASNDDNYASVLLNGAVCPFLSDGLCSIQQRLGEDYLSNMCATYPRVLNRVGEVVQRSLDLSCPEAARLALLDPRPITFLEAGYQSDSNRQSTLASLDTSSAGESLATYRSFLEIRQEIIAILQDRSQPLDTRILVVGSLCERIGGDSASFGLDDELTHGATDSTVQLETVLELIVARITSDSSSSRFLECYRDFTAGIQWTAESTMEEIGARYAAAFAGPYAGFIKVHEYMLEHYLVNYVHSTLFPFGVPQSNERLKREGVPSPVAAQYMLMVAYYSIIRTLLIGIAALHQSDLGPHHVIRLVQSCTKTFEHSVAYPGRVIEILASKKMTTATSLGVLIQNEL